MNDITKRIKWTEEMVREEALKYTTLFEFQQHNRKAYRAAHRMGIDSICSHMKSPYIFWSDDMLQEEALKFQTRNQFKKGSTKAWESACHRKIMDKICTHMTTNQTKWTDEMLAEEASKYSTRKEFEDGSYNAYDRANSRGIMDKICTHMKSGLGFWSDDMLQEEALKYTKRADFVRGYYGAYSTAKKRGILDEICSHMERGHCAFDPNKRGTLYVIAYSLREPHGDTLHEETLIKIGITNRTTKTRMKEHRPYDHTGEILHEVKGGGADIAALEKQLLARYKNHKYTGKGILQSGNTELFHESITKTVFHHILSFKGKQAFVPDCSAFIQERTN